MMVPIFLLPASDSIFYCSGNDNSDDTDINSTISLVEKLNNRKSFAK